MRNWVLTRGKTRLIDLQPVVFIGSTLLILGFVLATVFDTRELADTFSTLQTAIANDAGWVFVLAVNLYLGYCVWLMSGRYRGIRLGGPDARPEFSWPAWFSMLFSAGMGIGLMFYSVAEPMYHFVTPPHGAVPGSADAAEDAMKTTFLHWGLHAWAIYALMGLALAYFAFNRNQPLSIRVLFHPLLGERIHGLAGHTIDILATVATLFGVATSLGLGVQQINAGLNHLAGVPVSANVQLVLIAGITGLATLSVVSGVKRGIRLLSEANMFLAIGLLLLVLVLGPTLFVMNGLVENVGAYLDDFFYLGFWNETYTGGEWQNGWTVFYWGWWVAWSPFVGMFIARISRGRTVGEFVMGVLLVPTLFTFLWLSVFGNSALYLELFHGGGLADAVAADLPRSLYSFLERLVGLDASGAFGTGLGTLLGGIATLVVVSFFVTSSDSGSLVIDIITAGGRLDPPVAQRIFWALLEGVVAAALLLGGGLVALQTAAIATGLPFALLLLLLMWSLHRALGEERPATST